MKLEKVAVLGAGAVGAYVLWGLSEKPGIRLGVVAEGERARRLQNGIGINGKVYHPEVWTPEEAHGADLLIVALKYGALAGGGFAAGPGHCGHMVLAVTLHNLPEGMVVGLAAALALEGSPEAVSGALALALGIGLQNIPEGAAVSLPLLRSGQSRGRAFLAGAASGLVEPLGGLMALAVAGWVSAALPWLMSAAAGCMVCVTAQEMIPQAVEPDESAGVISIVLGFALMMALDVAL